MDAPLNFSRSPSTGRSRDVSHTDAMMSARSQLADQLVAMPLIPRCAVVGATVAGILGAIVGLVLGLRAYAPTAWFAVIEVAVPAAIVGALLGAVAGLVAVTVQKSTHH
jgi:hypothetical protein